MLINRIFELYFGACDGVNLIARFQVFFRLDHNFENALFNALTDLLHNFKIPNVGSSASKIFHNLEMLCIDFHFCSDERCNLLLAFLARRSGDFVSEQLYLKHIHDKNPEVFWSTVQSVYRFTCSLPDLCNAVSIIKPFSLSKLSPNRINLIYFPAYRNSYQELLYASLYSGGGQVSGTSEVQEFLTKITSKYSENILHVHWINSIFGKFGKAPEDLARRAEAFLDGLNRQKQAGFQVFWTIHNYLSHESVDPVAEKLFRQKLYRLADRVFIHHPLAVSLLDWLPDHDKLSLCEHGHYDLHASNNISRDEARIKLGYSSDDFVLTYVGQIREYKGLGDSLPILFEQLLVTPHMKLVIAGEIKSGQVKAWLKEHTHPRLIVRNAYMSEEELVLQMRAADFGLLSYRSILTSGSLVHWLTCGRPVLAPRVGTIPAYVVPGWNGFLYDGIASFKHCLSFAIGLPHEECLRLEANALKTASQLEWRLWR